MKKRKSILSLLGVVFLTVFIIAINTHEANAFANNGAHHQQEQFNNEQTIIPLQIMHRYNLGGRSGIYEFDTTNNRLRFRDSVRQLTPGANNFLRNQLIGVRLDGSTQVLVERGGYWIFDWDDIIQNGMHGYHIYFNVEIPNYQDFLYFRVEIVFTAAMSSVVNAHATFTIGDPLAVEHSHVDINGEPLRFNQPYYIQSVNGSRANFVAYWGWDYVYMNANRGTAVVFRPRPGDTTTRVINPSERVYIRNRSYNWAGFSYWNPSNTNTGGIHLTDARRARSFVLNNHVNHQLPLTGHTLRNVATGRHAQMASNGWLNSGNAVADNQNQHFNFIPAR